jgi:hypothetical protein
MPTEYTSIKHLQNIFLLKALQIQKNQIKNNNNSTMIKRQINNNKIYMMD